MVFETLVSIQLGGASFLTTVLLEIHGLCSPSIVGDCRKMEMAEQVSEETIFYQRDRGLNVFGVVILTFVQEEYDFF